MRAEPVTSDWQVAAAMTVDENMEPDPAYCWTSAEIAASLGITVFQITARLKGMEGRTLVERYEGYWRLTALGYTLGTGPEPPKKEKVPLGERVYTTPTGGFYTPGAGAAALPDDSRVPRRSPEEKWPKMYYMWGRKSREWGIAEDQMEVFVDLDGTEWIKCHPNEIAELIVEFDNGLTPSRLRRRNGTTLAERKMLTIDRNAAKIKDYNERKQKALQNA